MSLPSPATDASIRAALKLKLAATHQQDDTVVLDELGVSRGEVRVDLAVVNGEIHGYEIKSERDSLRRLPNQVDIYSKVLDQATLVTAEGHLDAALAIIPDWWGVLCVDTTHAGLRFKSVRHSKTNPTRDARVLAEFLWLDDAIRLLEQHGLDRGVRSKPRRIVWDRISETLHIDVIATAVREHLKSRTVLTTAP